MIINKDIEPKVHSIKTVSLTEQAFEAVRHAIFTGQFLPGDPLREMHLARDLGVSQVVVREALVKLERLGLVVREANRGSFVTKLSRQEVSERTAVRVALEQMAFVAAAPNLAPDDSMILRRLSQDIEKEKADGRFFESAQFDFDFHSYVWRRANNDTLARHLEQVTVPLFAFISILRRSNLEGFETHRPPTHDELVDALETGHARQIKKAIREHLEFSYERFLQSGIDDFQTLARKLA